MRRPSFVTVVLIAAVTAAILMVGAPSSSDRSLDRAHDTTGAAPAAAAQWRTLMSEKFEGIFPPPDGNWSIYDYNGIGVGTPPPDSGAKVIWDDTSTDAHSGNWSAHPNATNRYSNNTDTWMRYGPISLKGATDARLRFWYFLESEKFVDFFSYSYSCKNDGNWVTQEVSGISVWKLATVSLAPCLGKTTVSIRFAFKSDDSNPVMPLRGVWVDDILVQKYSTAP